MTTLTEIEWEAPVLEPTRDRELERYVRDALGVVPPLATYFYSCPWIVRAMVAFDGTHVGLTHVDAELARLVNLVVSQDNSCRYCYAASRAMLKIFGFGEARIRRLEQDLSAGLSPAVTAALAFARTVSRANPLPTGADWRRLLDAGYSEAAVKELVFLVAAAVYYNRLATFPAVPTESMERLDRRSWAIAWVQPVVARVLAFKRRGIKQPHRELHAGPYAYLVDGFSGSPLAAAISSTLAEAWQSPLLPRRSKAFALAVVARGLGCALSEREATRLLAAEGVATSDVEATLTHLSSPILDPVEASIVPFARETIWYRPAQIQRRARALRSQLTGDQFLELVGITSLANAVCRMSAVIAPH